MISQNPNDVLLRAYEHERVRLSSFIQPDNPQGDYAHPVFGCGNLCADVMFVGEAPGREEAESGIPFIGKAGRQLDQLFAMAALDRSQAYVTNVVKYRPVTRSQRSVRNRTPGKHEIAHALELLQTEIITVGPRVIVTLGNTPLLAVLTLSKVEQAATIGKLHGRSLTIAIDGFVVDLFPLYHPASGIYNRMLLPIMEQDILALGEHLVKAR